MDLWFDLMENEYYSPKRNFKRTPSDEIEDKIDELRLREREESL